MVFLSVRGGPFSADFAVQQLFLAGRGPQAVERPKAAIMAS
jgi:hypothetical protein